MAASPSPLTPLRCGRPPGLHAAAAGGALLYPPAWAVAAGAVLANHLVLAGAGLRPRSRLLGPNWTGLTAATRARGEIAITLDDGPNPEVTPEVLDILDDFDARASFFVVGRRLQHHMDLRREILRRGHALENPSHGHRSDFALLGPTGLRREIQDAQQAIAAAGGEARYFRAPAGVRNPLLEGQLRRQGLELVSWTRRGFNTAGRKGDRVHPRLTRELDAGDIVMLHDGHGGRTGGGAAAGAGDPAAPARGGAGRRILRHRLRTGLGEVPVPGEGRSVRG